LYDDAAAWVASDHLDVAVPNESPSAPVAESHSTLALSPTADAVASASATADDRDERHQPGLYASSQASSPIESGRKKAIHAAAPTEPPTRSRTTSLPFHPHARPPFLVRPLASLQPSAPAAPGRSYRVVGMKASFSSSSSSSSLAGRVLSGEIEVVRGRARRLADENDSVISADSVVTGT